MTAWPYIEDILNTVLWLVDPARHFLYSAIAGFLAYRWILTTLSAHGWVWERLTRRWVSSGVVYIMVLSSLLLASAAALALHYVLDYVWLAGTLPLHEELELVIPKG